MSLSLRPLLVGLCVLVLATPAFGACEDVENGLGIYFDEGTWEENCFVPTVGSPVTMYFVLRNPAPAVIHGFELDWRLAADVVQAPLGCVAPGVVDLWECSNFHVGYAEPRPAAAAMMLVEVTLLLLAEPPDHVDIQAGPATPATLPGFPAVAGPDPADVVPLNFCGAAPGPDGWSEPGLAYFHIECDGIAVDAAAWGTIKSLYR